MLTVEPSVETESCVVGTVFIETEEPDAGFTARETEESGVAINVLTELVALTTMDGLSPLLRVRLIASAMDCVP